MLANGNLIKRTDNVWMQRFLVAYREKVMQWWLKSDEGILTCENFYICLIELMGVTLYLNFEEMK